jgi:hypothetical protein
MSTRGISIRERCGSDPVHELLGSCAAAVDCFSPIQSAPVSVVIVARRRRMSERIPQAA